MPPLDELVGGAPAYRTYSPELQLRILQATLAQLQDPILDLGCGPKAELVTFLRAQGKEAFGVDWAVKAGSFLWRADWLDLPLDAKRWGAVISHMAFSSHFLHQHLHPNGHPERYARRYMEVLQSLKAQGSFWYAPGLPFMEKLLPRDDYAVETFPVSELLGSKIDQALQTVVGQSVFYSCKITRRVSKD
jgi:hypothetical protein